jgi:hypothetical protein
MLWRVSLRTALTSSVSVLRPGILSPRLAKKTQSVIDSCIMVSASHDLKPAPK